MRRLACIGAVFALACGGASTSDGGRDAAFAFADSSTPDVGASDPASDASATDVGAVDGGAMPSQAKVSVSPTSVVIRATADDYVAAVLQTKNSGGSPTGPLVLSFVGPDADRFHVDFNSPEAGLPPGGSGNLGVAVNTPIAPPDPVLGTTLTATLVIVDSGPGGSMATAHITAFIIPASRDLTIVGPADMGTVALGESGASRSFWVVNSSTVDSGPLRVSLSTPEFAITADACTGTSLPASAMCSFSVQFSPTDLPGIHWAVLTVQGTSEDMIASEFISSTAAN